MSINQLQKTSRIATPPFQSWKVFDVACQCLTVRSVQNIFGKSYRLVRAWATDPATSEFVARNPLDRGRDFNAELVNAGAAKWAWGAVNYLAEPLSARLTAETQAKSVSGNFDEEAADIFEKGGEFVRFVRKARQDGKIDTAERIRLDQIVRDLVREIEQAKDAAGVK